MAFGINSSNILQWYSERGGVILDRMCCYSYYLDSQISNEAKAYDYYNTRSTTVPTQWLSEEIRMEPFIEKERHPNEMKGSTSSWGACTTSSSFGTSQHNCHYENSEL
jgi:hypothetical protein